MAKRDPFNSPPDAVKIGLLSDMPEVLNRAKSMMAELVRSEYTDRSSRPIEFVHHEYHGAPVATTRNAIDGFNSLVDQGCLIVVGGNHSDNCRVVIDAAESRQVPFISLGASEHLVSDYGFSVGWGTIPHDSYLLANWCRAKGYERVTVTTDRAWHCHEYLHYLRAACDRWHIRILSQGQFSEFRGEQQRRQAQEFVNEHRKLEPQAILSFASSSSSEAWVTAVHEAGWNVPRAMNANFVRICQPRTQQSMVPNDTLDNSSFWEAREGWHGTSVVDEDNRVLTGMLARFEAKFKEKPFMIDALANYYDALRVAIEAVIGAHLLSPQGVKEALEGIKFLPAAAGGASTVIGFGPWDRMGIKGKDPYVLRRIENGGTVLAHRFDASL